MKQIQLNHGKTALVDDGDFDSLNRFHWSAWWDGYNWYAIKKQRGKISMHRFLLGLEAEEIDHRDLNGLNNQRSNLRICSHAENTRNQKLRSTNRSGFKGVYWSRRIKRWIASIGGERTHHIGTFLDKKKAALAYDREAIKRFGLFASTNKSLGLL